MNEFIGPSFGLPGGISSLHCSMYFFHFLPLSISLLLFSPSPASCIEISLPASLTFSTTYSTHLVHEIIIKHVLELRTEGGRNLGQLTTILDSVTAASKYPKETVQRERLYLASWFQSFWLTLETEHWQLRAAQSSPADFMVARMKREGLLSLWLFCFHILAPSLWNGTSHIRFHAASEIIFSRKALKDHQSMF